eukprot:Nk52_evm46s62 gene=Nk52_evmTU46s62
MTRKFLVLVDGSHNAERAAKLAAERTNRLDADEDELLIMHVSVRPEQNSLPLNQQGQTLKRKFESLCSSYKLVYDRSSPVPLNYHVDDVSVEDKKEVVSAISSFINDRKPDVVVLGNFGLGNKEDVNGSVITRVLQCCPASLVIKHFRPVPDQDTPAKFLITTDGSTVSEQAVDIGCKLLRPSDTVHIITLSGQKGPKDESILEKCHEIAKKRKVPEDKCCIEYIGRDSQVSIGKQLCQLAEKEDIDFLVMGSVGIGSATSLGSVAKFVLKNSRSHNLVVREL